MTSTSRTAGPDRWQHYGASLRGRRSLRCLHWDWYQRIGPGAELLGDLTGRTVAELGSGPGHQAAYVATELKAVRVIAIDSSTAQHSRGRDLYTRFLPQGLDLLEGTGCLLMGGCMSVFLSITNGPRDVGAGGGSNNG